MAKVILSVEGIFLKLFCANYHLGELVKRLTARAPDSWSLMDLRNQDFKKTKIKPGTVIALKLCFEKQGR